MGIQQEQIASNIRAAVQEILQRGVQDPRVRGLISITRVDVTDDGEQATIHLSVMPREHAELTIHGIRHAGRHIRSQLARKIRVRRLPRLFFRLDDSLKKQASVIDSINRAAGSDENGGGDDAGDADDRAGPTPPTDEANRTPDSEGTST